MSILDFIVEKKQYRASATRAEESPMPLTLAELAAWRGHGDGWKRWPGDGDERAARLAAGGQFEWRTQ